MRREAFPAHFDNRKIFVAQSYVPGKEHIIDFTGFKVERLMNYGHQANVQLIAGNSTGATSRMLQAQGFERDLLPRALGGNWDYDQLDDFIRERLTIEGALAAAPWHANRIEVVCWIGRRIDLW